jgi:hypothetical protein
LPCVFCLGAHQTVWLPCVFLRARQTTFSPNGRYHPMQPLTDSFPLLRVRMENVCCAFPPLRTSNLNVCCVFPSRTRQTCMMFACVFLRRTTKF